MAAVLVDVPLASTTYARQHNGATRVLVELTKCTITLLKAASPIDALHGESV